MSHAGLDPRWPGRGYYVVLEREHYSFYYMHLSGVLVRKGQKIEEDTEIGLTGNSGWSTGPHLHWGVQDKQNLNSRSKGFVDPTSFLEVA